ncbi:MAG: hypothetical protein L0Y48_02015 [Fusobacteria bacterium]|nr:hypothetical protein [Fusobacteriota bacterium]
MKNTSGVIKSLIALATIILASLLVYLTVYIYENYLKNIFTMQLSIINIIIMIVVNIGLAILIIYLIYKLIKIMINFISHYTFVEVVIGVIGIIISLRIVWLTEFIFVKIPIIGNYLLILLSVVLGVVGWMLALKKKDEIFSFIGLKKGSGDNKIVDTSVIIDGRIFEIIETGFIDGNIVIPDFVVDELQRLADSADDLKRVKGRQGLDMIKKAQSQFGKKIVISKTDDKSIMEIPEVDSKLVRLISTKGGSLLTNDFNLNKVAALKGIIVLNLNDLANAVKPILIPGEEFQLLIIKKGKENNQGVGYLDDGTMIIVEDGENLVGEEVTLIVTSVMQTSAGRLVFARLKGE